MRLAVGRVIGGIGIRHRVATLACLGLLGTALVVAIYISGHLQERRLQKDADLASLLDNRFSRVLASLAEAGQTEIAFLVDGGEPLAAQHMTALNAARGVLLGLFQQQDLPDMSRNGVRALLEALEDYAAKSEQAIDGRRDVGDVNHESIRSNSRAFTAKLDDAARALNDTDFIRRVAHMRQAALRFTARSTFVTAEELRDSLDVLIPQAQRLVADGVAGSTLLELVGLHRDATLLYRQARLDAIAAAQTSSEAFQEAWAVGSVSQGVAHGQSEYAAENIKQVRQRTDEWMSVATALVAAGIAGLAWLIWRGIERHLRSVTQVTRRLSDGDRNVEVEHTTRKDEIGELARALCAFQETLVNNERASERIQHLAYFDSLTGVNNRMFLKEQLHLAIADCTATGSRLAVLFLDLDGFKAVNDVHGHAAGDTVLREIARRLERQIRATDLLTRFGGDEFVIVLRLGAEQADPRLLADRLIDAAKPPIEVDEAISVDVTASVGIALFPRDGPDRESLLQAADVALYRSKLDGKNRCTFFEPDMRSAVLEKRSLEADLRHALERGELSLAWQPIAHAAYIGDIVGYEALLRWTHPERGAVRPDVFIPIAESSGLINEIGHWVLQQACAEAARWPRRLWVSVNVSPIQVQIGEAFGRIVADTLTDTGLDPARLMLEVTEGVIIREPARVTAALMFAKKLGVQIALDDFGTGYSSLATLRAFPFDKIKIDRSFVAGMTSQSSDAAIVRAIIGLASGLKLPVVAEGVETRSQLLQLAELDCDEVQGWLIGRPGPIPHMALPHRHTPVRSEVSEPA